MAEASDWLKVAGQMAAVGLPGIGTLLGGLAGSAAIPGVGTALGGSIGGALGKAASQAIGAALGVPPEPEAITQAVAANPGDAQVKLAQIEAEAQQRIAELQDVQNARAMLVSLEQAHAASGKAPAILSTIAVLTFLAALAGLFFIRQEIPTSVNTLLSLVIGALVTRYGQVFDFWLGSSRSSQKKDAQLAGLLTSPITPVTKH